MGNIFCLSCHVQIRRWASFMFHEYRALKSPIFRIRFMHKTKYLNISYLVHKKLLWTIYNLLSWDVNPRIENYWSIPHGAWFYSRVMWSMWIDAGEVHDTHMRSYPLYFDTLYHEILITAWYVDGYAARPCSSAMQLVLRVHRLCVCKLYHVAHLEDV